MAGQTGSILVKPVGGSCNLRCDYCFYTSSKTGRINFEKRMELPVLHLLTEQIFQLSAGLPYICWQGGEPTLAGIDFYRHAIRLQRLLGKERPIINSIQTNGQLIDKEWAKFLSTEKFLVGLSLDGPPQLNDIHRLPCNGACKTGQKALDAAHRLFDAGASVNAMCCLTSSNAPYICDIYSFFKNEGFSHVQFIPILESSGDEIANFSLSSESYGDTLCKLWDIWVKDIEYGHALGIRFFESFIQVALGFGPLMCEMNPACGQYAVVEADGTIYPCDFFTDHNWNLGNLINGLKEVLISQKSMHFNELRLLLDERCQICKWKRFCYGGCLKYRKVGRKLSRRTLYCDAYKKFFDHAENDIGKISLYMANTNIF